MARFTFDQFNLRTPDPKATTAYDEEMFGAEIVHSTQQGVSIDLLERTAT